MHAYIVLAHQLPEQLARLVDRIATPEDHVFLHLDKGVNATAYYTRAAGLDGRPDVTLLPRVACRWGGFSLVEATLSGVRAAIDSGRPFIHASLLSGQDYPIKPPARFREELRKRPDTLFMAYHTIPTGRPGDELGRVDRRFYHLRGTRYISFPNRFLPIPSQRPFPLGFTPYKGSQWWTLPFSAVREVSAFTAAHPDYLRFFERVLVPDEYYFQSTLVNTGHEPVDDNLRFIDWPLGAYHPRSLGVEDVPRLAASDAFFARKFDSAVDPEVLDRIDAELLSEG
ncbi:MAG: beta-1,6-N-acetylglucosaminyltransferase [Actinomycetota bacterium]|nr:beta-1,6-N-acetylglucosaminyltransferase [Actinomycetota bacterium]